MKVFYLIIYICNALGCEEIEHRIDVATRQQCLTQAIWERPLITPALRPGDTLAWKCVEGEGI